MASRKKLLNATVHPRNADRIMALHLARRGRERQAQSLPTTTHGTARRGHSYTKTIHHGRNGRVSAEQWLVRGAGHAWSGGTRGGSFTDPKGPDASMAMLRFFAQHSLGGALETAPGIARASA